MSFTRSAKRLLVGALTGAMVLSLLPAGMAAADEHGEVCDNVPESGFTDLEGSVHAANIECMAAYGVGQGFDDLTFRPGANITRAQMATLLVSFAETALDVEELELPEFESPFTDIEGNVHEDNINAIAALEIAQGTTDTTYSPNATVTRAQFASFVAQAHIALGVEFDEVLDLDELENPFTDTVGNIHEVNISILAALGIVSGQTETTYNPAGPVERGQVSTILAESAVILDGLELWNAPRLDAPDPDPEPPTDPDEGTLNPTFADAPTLQQVRKADTGETDRVVFQFDRNVEGKSLNFLEGAQNLGDGTQVRAYPGLRIYDEDGTVYYPYQARIEDNNVFARFLTPDIVEDGVRASVVYNTVRTVAGKPNVEGASGFAPDAVAPELASVNLISVENYRVDTTTAPQRVLVDFVFDTTFTNPGAFDAADFYLIGSNSREYQGRENRSPAGASDTVTIKFANDQAEVPQNQLRRGYVDEDTVGDDQLLSATFAGTDGITVDPDLLELERSGNQVILTFDQPISDGFISSGNNAGTLQPLFVLYNADGDRTNPTFVARSATNLNQVIATFETPSVAAGTALVDDAVGLYVLRGAVEQSETTATQNDGLNRPAQRSLPFPELPDVPAAAAGVTDIPDLVEVVARQNSVTQNWSVTFRFNDPITPAMYADLGNRSFALYDDDGTRLGDITNPNQETAELLPVTGCGTCDVRFTAGNGSFFSNEDIVDALEDGGAGVEDFRSSLRWGLDTPVGQEVDGPSVLPTIVTPGNFGELAAPAITEGSLEVEVGGDDGVSRLQTTALQASWTVEDFSVASRTFDTPASPGEDTWRVQAQPGLGAFGNNIDLEIATGTEDSISVVSTQTATTTQASIVATFSTPTTVSEAVDAFNDDEDASEFIVASILIAGNADQAIQDDDTAQGADALTGGAFTILASVSYNQTMDVSTIETVAAYELFWDDNGTATTLGNPNEADAGPNGRSVVLSFEDLDDPAVVSDVLGGGGETLEFDTDEITNVFGGELTTESITVTRNLG